MTDGQSLYAVFAALYVVECMRWLPSEARCFHGWARHWSPRHPFQQIRHQQGSPLLLPVLPPPALHLVTMPWLLAPTSEGLEVGTETLGRVVIPWDCVEPKAEGSILQLGSGQFLRWPDERVATEWQQRLLTWRKMKPAGREADFLKFARRSLDPKSSAAAALRLTKHTGLLRWLGGFIFIWTFGVVAGVYRWYGDGLEIAAAAMILYLAMAVQAVAFWRATRNPEGRPAHRIWQTLGILFLPQYAIRAADSLCRAGSATAHPLALKGLIDDRRWRLMAAAFWREMRYGSAKSADLQRRAIEDLLKRQAIDAAEFDQAPTQQEGSVAYCPRCLTQFRRADAICQDCGGLAVKTWAGPA